jgi:hypothetical protein
MGGGLRPLSVEQEIPSGVRSEEEGGGDGVQSSEGGTTTLDAERCCVGSTTTAGGGPTRLNLATTARAPTKVATNMTGRATEQSCSRMSTILRLVARFTTAEAARWIGAVAYNVVLGEAVET